MVEKPPNVFTYQKFNPQNIKTMKNIFLLPTNAPSRLYEFGGEIILTDTPTSAFRNQTIFIVCSDDIKEDNWYLDKDGLIAKCVDEEFIRSRKEIDGLNKIILATDPMLIAEGVQAINDGFLEWFVKNPTCEEVKIEWNATSICKRVYNIIIPKEETIKNIFLLPTDNPSRLISNSLGFLMVNGEFTNSDLALIQATFQNIYITSNEEPKEGDWVYDIEANYVRQLKFKHNQTDFDKKIILTTEKDLITEGIHKIDDKFLEWFVKNPTCEEVKIEWNATSICKRVYNIIIPKEEAMKNIFLLPTDKPSKLCVDRHKKLLYYAEDNWFKKDEKAKAQNIYITSDEKIKEGYFINGDMLCKYDESHASEEWKTNEFVNGYSLKTNIYYSFESEKCKKVILATDPMLIADGVHKIDDKFLEWFVKNPTCEFVNLFNSKWQLGKDEKDYYDIIIPKKTNKSNEDIWDEVYTTYLKQEGNAPNAKNMYEWLKENYNISKK